VEVFIQVELFWVVTPCGVVGYERLNTTTPHGVKVQETSTGIFIAVKVSNLAKVFSCSFRQNVVHWCSKSVVVYSVSLPHSGL
jgi:hypothetical protein